MKRSIVPASGLDQGKKLKESSEGSVALATILLRRREEGREGDGEKLNGKREKALEREIDGTGENLNVEKQTAEVSAIGI